MGITSKRGRVNLLYIIKFLSNYNLLIQSSYKKKNSSSFHFNQGQTPYPSFILMPNGTTAMTNILHIWRYLLKI